MLTIAVVIIEKVGQQKIKVLQNEGYNAKQKNANYEAKITALDSNITF